MSRTQKPPQRMTPPRACKSPIGFSLFTQVDRPTLHARFPWTTALSKWIQGTLTKREHPSNCLRPDSVMLGTKTWFCLLVCSFGFSFWPTFSKGLLITFRMGLDQKSLRAPDDQGTLFLIWGRSIILGGFPPPTLSYEKLPRAFGSTGCQAVELSPRNRRPDPPIVRRGRESFCAQRFTGQVQASGPPGGMAAMAGERGRFLER